MQRPTGEVEGAHLGRAHAVKEKLEIPDDAGRGAQGEYATYHSRESDADSRPELVIQTLPHAYDNWAVQYQVVNGPLGDDDGDGWNNLMEYALGGNPKANVDLIAPTLSREDGRLKYSHLKRKNDSNLTYTVQVCTDLMDEDWESINVNFDKNVIDATFVEISFEIPSQDAQTWIRLQVIRQ